MLARSSSTAGQRLRRAKSTASTHGGRSDAGISTYEPLEEHEIRAQAVTAALAAYGVLQQPSHNDARFNHNGSHQKSADPVPKRRRGQHQGRSEGEGSHFAASQQVPRRQSSRRSNVSKTPNENEKPKSPRPSIGLEKSHLSTYSERKALYLNPNSNSEPDRLVGSTGQSSDPALSIFQRIRRARSSYSSVSQSANDVNTAVLESISFRSVEPTSRLSRAASPTVSRPHTPHTPVPYHVSRSNDFSINAELTKARDEHLQNFQRSARKMKRPSILLRSFSKRPEEFERVNQTTGDQSLRLDGITDRTPSILPAAETLCELPTLSEHGRTASGFRERIKRAFRRSSTNQPIVLPIQQVEATRPHFGQEDAGSRTGSYSFQSQVVPSIPATPTRLPPPPPLPIYIPVRTASPVPSEQSLTTEKSRVTSWTDSTVTGSLNSQTHKRLTIIQEDNTYTEALRNAKARNASGSSQAPSIFRRIIRKPSKGVSVTSAETLVGKSTANPEANPSHNMDITSVNTVSAIDSLPSQRKRSSSTLLSALRHDRPTVRAVTPETVRRASIGFVAQRPVMPTSKTDTPRNTDRAITPRPTEVIASASKPRNRLRKPSPMSQMPLGPTENAKDSKKQAYKRSEAARSVNRSLFFPRSPRKEAAGNRHYRSHDTEQSLAEVTDPYMRSRKEGTMSPSIYSRDTDFNDSTTSLRQEGQVLTKETGIAWVTPSQQLTAYSVGFPKQDQPRKEKSRDDKTLKTSRDWRNWLSREVAELETPPPMDFALSSEFIRSGSSDSRHIREHAQIHTDEDIALKVPSGLLEDASGIAFSTVVSSLATIPTLSRPPSAAARLRGPSSSARGEEPRRPSSRLDRDENRPPSRMNDRFPLIDTGRPPSRTRKFTPPLTPVHKHAPPSNMEAAKDVAGTPDESDKENVRERKIPLAPPLPPKSLRRPHSAFAIPTGPNKSPIISVGLGFHPTAVGGLSQIPLPSTSIATSRPRAMTSQTSRLFDADKGESGHKPQLRRPASALSIRPRKMPSKQGVSDSDKKAFAPSTLTDVARDPTIAAIMKGPYAHPLYSRASASSSSTNLPIPTSYLTSRTPYPFKENTSPSIPTGSLVQPKIVLHPREEKTVDVNKEKEGSPGQRMAEQFLHMRKWREDLVISPSPGATPTPSPGKVVRLSDEQDKPINTVGRQWGREDRHRSPAFL